MFLPRVQQSHGISRRNGEEQFKIFTVGQRGEERWFARGLLTRLQSGRFADGYGIGEQFGAHVRRVKNMPQIAGQAVAEVDHGVNGKRVREPAALLEAGLKFEVLPSQRSAQFSCDK